MEIIDFNKADPYKRFEDIFKSRHKLTEGNKIRLKESLLSMAKDIYGAAGSIDTSSTEVFDLLADIHGKMFSILNGKF